MKLYCLADLVGQFGFLKDRSPYILTHLIPTIFIGWVNSMYEDSRVTDIH